MLTSAVMMGALVVGQPVAATPPPSAEPVALPQGAVAQIGSPAFRHRRATTFLGTSADGKRVYTAEKWPEGGWGSLLHVWDAASGRLLSKHLLCTDEESVSHVGFGPDGVRVVVVYDVGRQIMLRVVDPDTGHVIRTGDPWPDVAKESAIRFHGRGPTVSFGYSQDGGWFYRINSSISLTNTATGEELILGRQLHDLKYAPRFSHDGRLLYLVSTDNTTRVFSLPKGELIAEVEEPAEREASKEPAAPYRRAYVAGATPDRKSLAVWMLRKDGWSLELHDIGTNRWRVLLDRQTAIGRVHFAPDGKTVALCVNPGTLSFPVPPEVWVEWEFRDCATGRLIASIPVESTAQTGFSANGKTFYTLSSGVLVPWDAATGEPTPSAPSPLGAVSQFRFAPDGNLVGLAGGFVYAWDPRTGRELSRTRLPKGIHLDYGMALSPRADRVNFFTTTEELASWEISTGKRTQTKPPEESWARTQRWSLPDGRYMVERAGLLTV